jgi:homopolymeric O-antigen transport system ATP-binding protein
MEHVYMKFRRGEMYDSLRDLIPALVTAVGRKDLSTLAMREFWGLQDVSFTVERGEAFGVIGQNGAGKSTILKLLSGIMRPTKGNIQVRGKLSALIEVGAGFHPDLTGRENIFLNGTILGMTKAEIRRKFDEIVEFAGLADFIDTPVKRYSSGMYARLGFSVAAHVEPEVLIVDEVLSVGDYLFQQRCIERMNAILRDGTTVIFVSHNLHAIAGLCKRSLLLEKGKVVACTSTEDVIRLYLQRAQPQSQDEQAKVSIEIVSVRQENSSSVHFETGQTALVDVAIAALADISDVAIFVQVVDHSSHVVVDTCSARLGGGSVSLRKGERLEATFALELHLAAGVYHINVFAENYITDKPYAFWRPAATFFVGETPFVKGRANVYPRLLRHEVSQHNREEMPRREVTGDTSGTNDRVVFVNRAAVKRG